MIDQSTKRGNHPVKHRVIRALRRSSDHLGAVEEGVSEAIRLAVKNADRALGGADLPMDDIIRSAIDGAVRAGADLAVVARGILGGILQGGRDDGLATPEAFEHAERTILHHAEMIGGDLGAASRGISQAAVRRAKTVRRLRADSPLSKAAGRMPHGAEDDGAAAREEAGQSLGSRNPRRSAS